MWLARLSKYIVCGIDQLPDLLLGVYTVVGSFNIMSFVGICLFTTKELPFEEKIDALFVCGQETSNSCSWINKFIIY